MVTPSVLDTASGERKALACLPELCHIQPSFLCQSWRRRHFQKLFGPRFSSFLKAALSHALGEHNAKLLSKCSASFFPSRAENSFGQYWQTRKTPGPLPPQSLFEATDRNFFMGWRHLAPLPMAGIEEVSQFI
jgi:hypothetical protein